MGSPFGLSARSTFSSGIGMICGTEAAALGRADALGPAAADAAGVGAD
jgi:hypothetical protein